MQILKASWDFFQHQLLGMKWLNQLIEAGLGALGLDTANRWIGSIQFFAYDVIKIVALTKKDRIVYAKEQMLSTFKSVLPYILIGVGIGAIIHNWIPEEWVVSLLGSKNPFGVILATVVGIPMYADIFGTIPIAEALLTKGAQLGTVLAFMMGVTTLSIPSLIMLRKAVKPKLLVLFIALCATGIIIVGYLFNALQALIVQEDKNYGKD